MGLLKLLVIIIALFVLFMLFVQFFHNDDSGTKVDGYESSSYEEDSDSESEIENIYLA